MELRASASPPRYIPPHLHDEVLDASAERARRESTVSTGASSPSEAYAGLSLENRETFGDTFSYASHLGEPGNAGEEASSSPHTQTPNNATISPYIRFRTIRSCSPAKRPASDMDDGVIVKDTMDVDQNNDTGPQPDENGSTGRSDPLNSTFEGRNHVRAASVDMLGNEHNQSSSDSRTESLAATSASNQGSTTSVTSVGGSPSSAVLDTLERKPGPSIPFPSLDEQVSQVTKLNMQALEEGAEGYVISQRWLIRVLARTSDGIAQIDFDKSALEGDIGPVDNSDLIIPGKYCFNLLSFQLN